MGAMAVWLWSDNCPLSYVQPRDLGGVASGLLQVDFGNHGDGLVYDFGSRCRAFKG